MRIFSYEEELAKPRKDWKRLYECRTYDNNIMEHDIEELKYELQKMRTSYNNMIYKYETDSLDRLVDDVVEHLNNDENVVLFLMCEKLHSVALEKIMWYFSIEKRQIGQRQHRVFFTNGKQLLITSNIESFRGMDIDIVIGVSK